MSGHTEDEVDAIVAECLDALERGKPSEVEDILDGYPALAKTVRSRIERVRALGLVNKPDNPERIGPYRVLQEIGQGGMGTVYLAQQRGAVKRRVAVKLIKLGMDTREILRRFDMERQALGLMDHPNIARVFDAGSTEDGRPWFAMEFVQGEPITKFCDRRKMSTEDRLELFISVCEAVQHAHQKGIIHRDLKPSNVLVTFVDDKPTPKIIDFGVAKATSQANDHGTLYTEHGRVLGTPEYMSPEQAGTEPWDVDTRTDIYSLGVLLYELLTGCLPYSTEKLRTAGWGELREILTSETPKAPSTRVRSSDTLPGTDDDRASERRALARRLRGDLDWITLKALEKDRTRRYPTAFQLAADIRRHLDDEPVVAGPPSPLYRFSKFARRYRTGVVSVTAILVALVTGTIMTSLASIREARARVQLEESQKRYRLLSLVEELRRAESTYYKLIPAWPRLTGRFEEWMTRYGEGLPARLPEVRATIAELEKRIARKDHAESVDADVFLRDTLVRMEKKLELFATDPLAQVAGMRDRLAWSKRVGVETVESRKDEWRATIAAIRAHPDYHSLEIEPQMGLVPLGRDPDSGLFEFGHPRSGKVPERDDEGKLRLNGESSLVFVLLAGGRFLMGAQSDDKTAGNFEPGARANEKPVHEVEIRPFFMSKYEMTKGQFKRLARRPDCSYWKAGEMGTTDGCPVESITYYLAFEVLQEHALTIPTEAQWEYAARARTSTPWWTGESPDTLEGAANLADTSQSSSSGASGRDDGWPVYCPVDTMRANRFGLHHVHGNVWEWCRDWFQSYEHGLDGDSMRLYVDKNETRRVYRGGSFMLSAGAARSAMRWPGPMGTRDRGLGVRPMREIDPK